LGVHSFVSEIPLSIWWTFYIKYFWGLNNMKKEDFIKLFRMKIIIQSININPNHWNEYHNPSSHHPIICHPCDTYCLCVEKWAI
jgi:hypothetical protein